MEYKEYTLDELLPYEQPGAYIVKSTEYNDAYETPVLTAGKTFILGYTNETEGVFDKFPVIIFDDFTTASKFVNFKFKVKSSAMKILNINTELVLPKYIFYRMQVINVDHSTHKRYWIQHYSKIKIKVPPISEQKRIVSKIEELFSSLDNAVETLNKTKDQLLIYRQAVLKKAFESDKEWEECVLGDVISVLTDYHSNGSYKDLKAHVTLLDEPDYAIMIRSTNFEKDDFSVDLKFINEDSYNYLRKSQIFGGEVLMGKIGNAGRVYYMKNLNCPVSLAMNLFAMRFRDDVDSKFVYYYLKTNEATMDIKQYVKGVGTPTIDKKGVRRIKFRFPDKNRQIELVKEIERRLSSCDSIEKTIDIALKQSEAIRKSILKEAFEGRLI